MSMKVVILLFTKKDAGDSEEFVFPNLTRIEVSVEGNPNDIYSKSLAKRDMYREAVRFFSNNECEKYLGTNCVSRRKYYTNKFACIIDFRTVDDDTVSGSGRKLVGTQAGILLQIKNRTSELVKLGFHGSTYWFEYDRHHTKTYEYCQTV